MIRFKVSHLHARAKNRPPGYVDDVLAHGKVEGAYITFEDDVYDALVGKYRPKPLRAVPTSREWGPPMWAELHEAGREGRITPEFIANFNRRVPTSACGCRGHWETVLGMRQPPYGASAREQFAWTVEAHNAVNLRLGKAKVAIETALLRWAT